MFISKLFKSRSRPGASTTSAIPTASSASGSDGPSLGNEPDELFEEAQKLQRQGQLERAIELYRRVIELAPSRADAYYKRANAFNALQQLDAALADYDRAILLNPSYALALCNRGSVLERLGKRDEALASFELALAIDPKDYLAHYNRGSVLKDLERFDEALASYDAALALNAAFAEAWVNRGNVLQRLLRHDEAIGSFGRAIEHNPALAQAYQGRSASLQALRQLGPALLDLNKAIELNPKLAGLYFRRGNLLCEMQRQDAAVSDYLKATELDPTSAASYHGLASAFVRLKKLDSAIACFEKAKALYPDGEYLLGTCRWTKMQACQWEGLQSDLELISRGLEAGKRVCNPMALASLMDSPALQRTAAEIWVQDQIMSSRELKADLERIGEFCATRTPRESGKIRLGYFSSDLRAHPVGFLTAGMFERHDRSKFEVTAFAFGPAAADPMQVRLGKAFDRYIDVRQTSDLKVATMARELQIDIAIDMNGFSDACRTRIFALRAAPIQINFLGYPGTMGAGFIDYLIADSVVVPCRQQTHYMEKIVYLPGSFMPFDLSYTIADRVFAREELGLPPAGFVFCCFNASYKILPEVFDRWMRILGQVEGSVLWLPQVNSETCGNLRNEAARRGIDARRLVFAQRMNDLPEHLARLRVADLFLDTLPYNAHATAIDALWAGLPLLTCAGDSFSSRVAASLLHFLGLSDLIAASPSDYEARACELASNRSKLGELRQRIVEQRGTSIFDTVQYTRNLENAYQLIYERLRSGKRPEHINEHLAI